MNPLHIVTNKNNISSRVLLPGDPLRAKYIADNFLNNAKLINNVRNMLGYTGTYKGIKITVIGSGMGVPSAALYAYELFKFYNVKKIIRIGTAGTLTPKVHSSDIVLGTHAYSDSNFHYALTKSKSKKISSSNTLNQIILSKAKELNLSIKKGYIYTTEVFDPYESIDHLLKRVPKNIELLASEMEAFGIYSVSKHLNKDSACILSIADNKYEPDTILSVEERQNNLNSMITLALESIIK